MSHSSKFINPDEVVRHKDGKVDLFSTILARKDPESQIPVLEDTLADQSTSSVSQPLPSTIGASQHQRQYPASAPTTDQRKRRQSNSPSPPVENGKAQEHVAKAVKVDGKSSNADRNSTRTESPQPVKATIASAGAGRAFERVFLGYCSKPSSVPQEIAHWHDEHHLIIKDMFPKAKVHMLVLPRQRIDRVTDLSGPGGIKTVEQLVERANWLLERLKTESPILEFKMGFHVIPSILQLHLHVISQDFCSPALKKKNHWNSFTTRFFIPPEQVISAINAKGSFALTPQDRTMYEAMLKRDLRCNQCKDTPKTMPALKKHLEDHFAQKAKARGTE